VYSLRMNVRRSEDTPCVCSIMIILHAGNREIWLRFSKEALIFFFRGVKNITEELTICFPIDTAESFPEIEAAGW